jgi:alpha-D-ribose 1-methylphosphonate 5-triphosphate synthase subunit PhnG
MAILAGAATDELARAWSGLNPPPSYDLLRRPETGLIMLQGRIGGDGGVFNLGEMTVTRCSVRLAGGTVGHAYVPGRDLRHAELAAAFDALMQDRGYAAELQAGLVEPLAASQAVRERAASCKAAATRVEFFTLVRGDD